VLSASPVTTAAKKHVLAPGPGVCCPADSRHRGHQSQLPGLTPPRFAFLELRIWTSRGPPVPQRGAGALAIAHYAQTEEPSPMRGSHAWGKFVCGQHGLQPHEADAALQGARATEERLLCPTKCLSLNETDFVILSSQYVVLIDICWALRDPSLLPLAWLIGIIEQSPALAGWGSPLLGRSSPAQPGRLPRSLAPIRLN